MGLWLMWLQVSLKQWAEYLMEELALWRAPVRQQQGYRTHVVYITHLRSVPKFGNT